MRLGQPALLATVILAILLIATLASTSVRATPSQSLPASCGSVGALALQAIYTKFPLFPVDSARGTIITVTNSSDALNENASSVNALLANPGPNGITLREAITATNNNPGVYTINFAHSLKGAMILVGSTSHQPLPPLYGGNVIIDGDIDGDGKPDVTLVHSQNTGNPDGLLIDSSGNTLYGLSMQGFRIAVSNPVGYINVNPGSSFIGNTISNMVLNVTFDGINFGSVTAANVTWSNMLVEDNTIFAAANGNQSLSGISFDVSGSNDLVEHSRVVHNTIVLSEGKSLAGSDGINFWLAGAKSAAVDILIADNTVQPGGYGVTASGGAGSTGINVEPVGDGSYVDGLWIEGNHVTMSEPGMGMGVTVESGENSGFTRNGYAKDAWILDNTIDGPGIQAMILGQPTGSGNSLQNLYVIGNLINMSSGTLTANAGSIDLWLDGAAIGPNSSNARNSITNIYVGMNTFELVKPIPYTFSSDVLLTAGQFTAFNNKIQNVFIFNNNLDGGGVSGINIIGGWNGNGWNGAAGNTVSQVQVWCNLVTPASLFASFNPPLKGVNLIGGLGYGGNRPTTNNTVEDILLSDNLVAGIPNDYAAINDYGPNATGDTVRGIETSPSTTTVTQTSAITSTVTSSTTITSTSVTTTTSTVTNTLPPLTSTTTVTVTGGGGLPESPYGTLPLVVSMILLLAFCVVVKQEGKPIGGLNSAELRAAAIVIVLVLLLSAPFLMVPAKATTSHSLPSSCGMVGAGTLQASYTKAPLYPVATSRGTAITVTTASDDLDGNVSSVSALLKNPGPDGTISLREAIMATNNSPGTYAISFAPSLKGARILVGSSGAGSLPSLLGGNVVINGDIDGDGKPDVTLVFAGNAAFSTGIAIASSGNTLYGLSLQGFSQGVGFPGPQPVPAGSTFSDTTISNMQMNITARGFGLQTDTGTSSDLSWEDTVIQSNTITVKGNKTQSGIWFDANTQNDLVTRSTVINNTIFLSSSSPSGPVGIAFFITGVQTQVSDVLVADNSLNVGGSNPNFINGAAYGGENGIDVIPNANGVRIVGVTIEGNHVTMSGVGVGFGIDILSGGSIPSYFTRGTYIKNVWVLDNTIIGPGIQAFLLGEPVGTQVSLQNLYVLGNSVNMSSGPATPQGGSLALWLVAGTGMNNVRINGSSTKDNVTNVYIGMNSLQLVKPVISVPWTDMLVNAGAFTASNNLVQDIYIFNNYLDGGGDPGLIVDGGFSNSTGNAISNVQAWCNDIPTATSSSLNTPMKGIDLIGGLPGGGFGAANNTVNDVQLSNNLVAGVVNDFSTFANLDTIPPSTHPSTTGNTVTNVELSPSISTVTQTNTVTSTVTSFTTVASTSVITSTISSTVISTFPPLTSTTTVSATSTATSTLTTITTTSGSGGIPEFPYQLAAITVLTVLVAASYLLVRRSRSRPVTQTH